MWIGILNVYTQCNLMPQLELSKQEQKEKNYKRYSVQRLFVFIWGER